MSTVAKPRQRGGRRPSQPHNGPTPGPLSIPGSRPGSHASTPTTSQPPRPTHSRQSSKSNNVIDLTSPTLPTPTRGRGRSGSIAKSVSASPSVLRSAAQEAFPPIMPTKGPLVVMNSRKKARTGFPFPTSLQQQQNSQAPYLNTFTSSDLELKMIPQPNKKPKRSTRLLVAPVPTMASRDNKPKAYVIEPPRTCTAYPFKDNSGKELKEPRFPDFFPWRGNHPEDVVTEHAARTGFSDKAIPAEQNSAKAFMTPLVRGAVSMDIISSLFVSVLEKRQQIGRITDPHTFRIPPRMSLTAARKEAWMKDLVNPRVPLRKLSRTISNVSSARGKEELLDECTNKNVPLLRATWYARSSGANDLRTLKKKGAGSLAMGNESKWLREWTRAVVQYLQKGMAECGKDPPGASSSSKSSWKARMIYILRFTSHLYSENMLDRAAFLEWYLSLLEACSLERLPLAMLILQTVWAHIVSSRKYCRRLVDALLGKVKQILAMKHSSDLYNPLLIRLAAHLQHLALNHRQAFVEPKSWASNEPALRAVSDTKNPNVLACIENIDSRNRNLELGNGSRSGAGSSSSSARKATIDFLDSIRAPYDIDKTTGLFLRISNDYHQTVKALCEWAVTSLRVGLYRVYFAVKILRKINRLGVHIQTPMHDFLLSCGGGRRSKKHVYLLISELVRSRHFTAGKYMSWLISRGALMRQATIDEEQPCFVRLLAEIPINHNHTPSAQRNLRSNLLQQKGFLISNEIAGLAKAKQIVSDRIPGVFNPGRNLDISESPFSFEEIEFISGLTRNVMSELGFWICDGVRKKQAHNSPSGSRGKWKMAAPHQVAAISASEFLLIRKALEVMEDYGILSEVIRLVTSSEDPEILAAAADTMSSNVDVYFAIGSVHEILAALFESYKTLQVKRTMEHRPVEQYLTTSLFNFAQYPGCDNGIKQSLENDFVLGKAHAMLPYPVTDTLSDVDEHLDPTIEGLLSGTIALQTGMLPKAFQMLIEQVDQSYSGSDLAHYRRFPRLLTRLRQLDPTGFDSLMELWLVNTIKHSSRPTLAVALSNLLVANCFELKTVIRVTSEIISQAAEDSGSIEAADITELAFQTLALLLDDEDGKLDLAEQEMYSLRLERKRFRANNGKLFVSIFRKAIRLCVAAADTNLERRLEDVMNNEIVLDLLRNLAFSDFDMLVSELVEPLAPQSNPLISKYLSLLIDHLLDEHDSNDVSEVDADIQVTRLLQYVNDFSVRLCQLKMRLIFEAEISHATDPQQSAKLRNDVTKAFVASITEMNKDRGSIWADLVSVLDETCVAQIRVYAEEMILNSATFPNASVGLMGNMDSTATGSTAASGTAAEEEAIKASESLARALIAAIDVTASGGSSSASNAGNTANAAVNSGTWLPPILADKMNLVLQAVGGFSGEITIQSDGEITGTAAPANNNHGSAGGKANYARLRSWIALFLRIIALHKSEFASPKTSAIEQGRIVIGLCALLQNKHVQNDDFIFEFTLDVACSIVDDMSEDSRHHIRRFVKRKYDLPHIAYLLGGTESAGPATGTAGATAAASNSSISGGSEWLRISSRGRTVEYPLKPWEQISDPLPNAGDNDTSLAITLFCARKVGCKMIGGA